MESGKVSSNLACARGSILQVARLDYGSVAQLGERLNGIEKVESSNLF